MNVFVVISRFQHKFLALINMDCIFYWQFCYFRYVYIQLFLLHTCFSLWLRSVVLRTILMFFSLVDIQVFAKTWKRYRKSWLTFIFLNILLLRLLKILLSVLKKMLIITKCLLDFFFFWSFSCNRSSLTSLSIFSNYSSNVSFSSFPSVWIYQC